MPYKDMSKRAQAIQRNNERSRQEYDRIALLVPKGKRVIITRIAKEQNKSINKFITDLLYNSYPEILDEDNNT